MASCQSEAEVKFRLYARVYYSLRTVMLASTIFFTCIWFIIGFDSTVEQLLSPDKPGLGFHWSTLQAMSGLAYILAVNFQMGNLTWSRFITELKRDLRGIRGSNFEEYVSIGFAVDPRRALIPIIFIPFFALFLFEVPYIFTLGITSFGDLFSPIYILNGMPRLVFYRDFTILLGSVAATLFFLSMKKPSWVGENITMKYRGGKTLAALCSLCLSTWIIWVFYSSPLPVQTVETLQLNQSESWLIPHQKQFQQNTYIYYSENGEINGWHQDEPILHLINITVKYLVFLAVGYVFLVKIRR